MGVLKAAVNKLKTAIKMCDLFKTTQFLRYNTDPQYRTLTGGTCSLMIVILFIAVFSTSVINTLNKNNLNWNYNLVQETSQQFTITATTATPAKFMFAVGVSDLDMNKGQRYFDIFLTQNYKQGTNTTTINIPLVPCQRSFWEGANDTILQIYDRLNFNRLLCPPQNQSFDISGMQSAYDFKHARISAQTCNPTLSTRLCASNNTIEQYLLNNPNFYLRFYFINTLLNPSKPNQISFYLEDRNSVPFNLQYGGQCKIFISEYNVVTDQSILPYNRIRTSVGGLVNFIGQLVAARTFRNEMASLQLRKSSVSMYAIRQYDKLDSTLSYMGGLFGFLLILFLFMQVYTEYSYEIQMGDSLYHYDKHDPLNSKDFNFLTFIGYLLYTLLQKLNFPPEWSIMKKYDDCRIQIQKQFDVSLLMKRLIFLERSIRILFEDHQFKMLHMYEKLTLKNAQQLREFYRMRDRLNADDIELTQNQQITEQKSSNKSREMNITDNIMVNQQTFKEQILDLQFQSRSQTAKNNSTKKLSQQPPSDKMSKRQSKNDSQLKQARAQKSSILLAEPDFSSKFKLLHQESQNGNLISKKIYEGFDTVILKNLLVKVQKQSVVQQQNDKNEDVSEDNRQVGGQKLDGSIIKVQSLSKAISVKETKVRNVQKGYQSSRKPPLNMQNKSRKSKPNSSLNNLYFQDIS